MLRCDITTPAGTRVDPDVCCKYAVLGRFSRPELDEPRASRSSLSTCTIDGADPPDSDLTYWATVPAIADVVRMTDGDASRRTELTRSSLTPPSGTERGTAICPACNAPRNATTYSSPCGAMTSARSPVDPRGSSSAATLRVRRYSCAHVRLSATPDQSWS